MRNAKRLDAIEGDLMRINSVLNTLVEQGVRIEDKIGTLNKRLVDNVTETLGWSQKIVDSLVEMTLAKSESPEAAAMHRAQVRIQAQREQEAEPQIPEPGAEWPPKDCTVLRSRG